MDSYVVLTNRTVRPEGGVVDALRALWNRHLNADQIERGAI